MNLPKRTIALLSLAALAAPVTAQPAKPAATSAQRQAEDQPIPRTLFLSNMDTQFRSMDSDRNGSLSRKELEDYQRAEAAAQAQARTRELFTRLDTDRNGVLTPAEFSKLITPNANAANAAPLLQRFDSNRDGTISLVEYRAGTLVNFDNLDTDKDGIVTAAEMKAGGIGRR